MKRSLVLLLALGACVGPPKPVVVPVAQPRPAPPPVQPAPRPLVAWEDRDRTPGNWVYDRVSGRSTATFGQQKADHVGIECLGDGTVRISRDGPSGGAMTIRTTTVSRTLAVQPGGEAAGGVAATLPANDPLLDAIVYSRGKFMISVAGLPDMILPPWPEIARVVEDCRK